MRIKLMLSVMLIVALSPLLGTAQTSAAGQAKVDQPKVDHLTTAELLDKAKALEASARAKGAASVKLNEYPNHYTMIALRNKNGSAEVHEKYADIFVILRGKATLVSGGSVVDPKTVGPGEITGTQVKDGSETAVHEGDVLHIPAGLPHQLLLPEKGELVYFVIKVKEL
jgi:mannose-6-phosphate isomerase-like protein (cupin superfamily)